MKKTKGYKVGGKTEKEKPFIAVDEKGKMMGGGMVPNTKGYFKGGKVMSSKTNTKGGKG